MKYSIVKFSDINNNENNYRLDADYYHPYSLENISKLKSHRHNKIQELEIKIVSGPFGSTLKSNEYLKEGIPFIRISDLKDFFIENTNLVYISNFDNNRLKSSQLAIGDIVLSKVGNTIGIASKVTNDIGNCNISENNIGIKFNKKINDNLRNFILTFLNSKYGQNQILRMISGNAQPKLNITDIYSVIIPIFSDKFNLIISNCINSAFEFKNNSKKKYKISEEVLLTEIGFENWQPKKQLWNTKNFSNTQEANRIDAEYFQSKYDEIFSIIKNNRYTKLSDNFDIIRNSNLIYEDNAKYSVLKTKQIKNHFIDYNIESFTNTYESKQVIIKDKDVIFASMGVGSLGKCSIYYKFESKNELIIDSTLKIFRKKLNADISPELLEVYINTQPVQELIYKNIVGSSGIISIYEQYLQELPIPIIDSNIQNKIINQIQESHKFKNISKQLLDIAKRGVEIAIEQDENIATDWIKEQIKNTGIKI